MLRRFAFVIFAVTATLQTGCCGRVHAFFYRLTHCDGCCPYYGSPAPACGAIPAYGSPGCSTCGGGAPAMGAPVAYPTAYSQPPVFSGAPAAMPGPSVYPMPPTPAPPEPKK